MSFFEETENEEMSSQFTSWFVQKKNAFTSSFLMRNHTKKDILTGKMISLLHTLTC